MRKILIPMTTLSVLSSFPLIANTAPSGDAIDLIINAGDPLDGVPDADSVYGTLTLGKDVSYIGNNVVIHDLRASSADSVAIDKGIVTGIVILNRTSNHAMISNVVFDTDLITSSSTFGSVFYASGSENDTLDVQMKNVNFNVTISKSDDYRSDNVRVITAGSDSKITIEGNSTIITDKTVNMSIFYSFGDNAHIDAKNVFVSVAKTTDVMGTIAFDGSDQSINLVNSTIVSADYNTLICNLGGFSSKARLDNVNLDQAHNQAIKSVGPGVFSVSLENGTHFHGKAVYVEDYTPEEFRELWAINIDLTGRAQWTLTANSNLGVDHQQWDQLEGEIPGITAMTKGHLSLDGTSCINFLTHDDTGDFYNINLVSILLANGSILNLDKDADASDFDAGSTITLFTGASGERFVNEGALLVTRDGYRLEYVDNNDGSFTFTGQRLALIPEASSAALALLAMVYGSARRRRS